MKEIPFLRKHRLIVFLVLLTVGFRVVSLKADPPSDFSWSGGYFADEGFWSHNARNEMLFGTAVTDEWNAAAMSPVYAGIQRWIFRLFGPGLAQVRFIGILSALLLAVSTYQLARKQFEPALAFGMAILVSLSFPMLILARQGILDPLSAALAWCSALCLMRNTFSSRFLAGIFAAAAIVTKYLMIYILVPLLFLLLFLSQVHIVEPEDRKMRIFPFLSGIVLCGFVWLYLVYLPNANLIDGYTAYYASQQNWGWSRVIKNVALQPFYLYFVKSPVLLFFGNLFLWSLVLHWRKAAGLEKFCWVWLVTGILFFSFWSYRPFRYYTSLLPPLAVLCGISMARTGWLTASLCEMKGRLFVWIGILIPAAQFTFFLLDYWTGWGLIPQQLGIPLWNVLVFLTLTVAVPAVLLKAEKPLGWTLAIFVASFLLTDMKDYLQWKIKPQYAALQISRDIEKRVGNGVVTGQWAPELCLENRVRNVPVWYGFVNSRDPFGRFGITHVLQWEYELGGEKFSEWYPHEFAGFHVVARYRIKDSDLVLYEKK